MQVHRNISDLPDLSGCVLTVGSFDGLHRGHRELFKKVRSLSRLYESPSVVATFHPHPREVIYPRDDDMRLITTQEEKEELFETEGIDHLVVVPFTVEFSQLLPQEYLEKFIIGTFNPSAFVVGYDHRFGLNRSGDIHMLRSYAGEFGFDVVEVGQQSNENIAISSTKIREAIRNGRIQKANELLGYRFLMSGRVVHGQKKGNGLGYPTANLELFNNSKLIPPDGVYATFVRWGSNKYEGMLYIGKRPTLRDEGKRSIEVHIFRFDKYIYGEKLVLEVVDRIRGDEQFGSLKELKTALQSDQKSVLKRLSEESAAIEGTTVQPS